MFHAYTSSLYGDLLVDYTNPFEAWDEMLESLVAIVVTRAMNAIFKGTLMRVCPVVMLSCRIFGAKWLFQLFDCLVHWKIALHMNRSFE